MAKKKSVLLILIVMLAFFAFAGLASCGTHAGNSESNSETVKETETAGPTETTSGTETTGETTSETTGETTSESTVAPEVKYTVKFMNGETEVASVEVKEGETVAQADIPVAPVSDYVFYGWFNGEVEFDAAAAVTADVTYVAKFSAVKAEHIGEWRGEGKDGNANAVAYVLTVTGETVSLKVGAAEAVAATDLAYDAQYGDLTFKLDGVAYCLGQSYGAYVITTLDDYSVYVTMSLVYDKPVEFGEEALVGAYETEAGVKIVINSTFVLVDGVQGTDFTSSSNGYSFYIDGVSASVSYNTEAWYYSVGGESDKIKTPVKEPVAIPEALIGNWSAVVKDATWGTTLYLVTITPDGLSVYYSEAFSWSDVVASYEAVEGGVVFNVGGDKITVTATADGKIKYVGNYTDVTLEKKIRIAFVNDYQIYYVADLKDDGTIDEENFALEDPVKEHNHFDGWFNQVGGAAFDDTATFEKGAYFEAKWTETEIPVKFDDVTVYVPVTDGVAKLTDVLIPAAPAAEEGKAFMGWYNGNVKAVAGLEVKKDAKFVSYFASEADFDGYWVYDVDKKEKKLVIDAATHTLTFGTEASVEYTFGEDVYAEKKNGLKIAFKLNITICKDGTLTVVHGHPDADGFDWEEDVYTGFKKVVAVTEIKDGVYKFDKNDYLEFKDGFLTKVNGSVPVFGYVEGTVKSLTIKYRTSSYGSATKIEKARYNKDRIICGTLKDNAKIYVWNSESVVDIYCGADKDEDKVNLYVHTVVTKATEAGAEDVKSTVYVVRKGGKYAEATVEGEIAVGNFITVTYRFVEGSKFVNFNEQYKIVTATTMVAAGAEKGEYTSETLGTLKLDGFGNATVTNGEDVKTYVYVINGAGVVVLKNAEGAVVDGVKLAEGNTFAKAEVVGEYGKYINSNNPQYTMVIDQFGGATVYYSSYVYYGKYTVDASAGTITVSDINYSYNGVYVKYDDGKVYVNNTKTTPVVLVAEGYTPVNHIDEFAGYYVNGDNVVKIVVADGKATVLVNKVAVKAKANWNGTEITYKAHDAESSISTVEADYVVTKDGVNLIVKHKCFIGFDADGAPEFSSEYTVVTYTPAEEPVELDGLQGTYKNGSAVITLDGKGNGTYVKDRYKGSFTYSGNGTTKNVTNFSVYDDDENTFTITEKGIKVAFSGDCGGYTDEAEYIKEAAVELDAFAGNWKVYDTVFAFDGKGTVVVTGSSFDGTFSYTVSGDTVTFKNTRLNEVITCKLSGADAILVSCECGEEYSNTKFTKQ